MHSKKVMKEKANKELAQAEGHQILDNTAHDG